MSAKKKSKYAPLSDAAKAKLEPYRDLMGKRPDGEIAKLAGMDRRYVVVFRTHNGIPAFRRGSAAKSSTSAEPKSRNFRRSRLDEFRHLMGHVADGKVAELAECSREAVMRYRKRHSITAAPRKQAPLELVEPVEPPVAEPAPPPVEPAVEDDLPPEMDEVMAAEASGPELEPNEEPVAAPTPVGGIEGYLVVARVDGEDQEWMVLAEDLPDAARKAVALVGARSPGAQVIELRYCADIL
jgi:hypothetical protein